MAGRSLSGRVDALEQVKGPSFCGFASVWWRDGQSQADAKLAWERDNDPVGMRQVIFWRWPGESLCA